MRFSHINKRRRLWCFYFFVLLQIENFTGLIPFLGARQFEGQQHEVGFVEEVSGAEKSGVAG
jgi:hypothetical protein